MSSSSPAKGIFVYEDDRKSVEFRKQGNAKYNSAFGSGAEQNPMVLRLADGKEALRLYWSAHAAAGSTHVSARLSAKKNIGMTHLRLATLPREGQLITLLTPEEIENHFQQSMSNLTEAHSGACKGRAWVEDIEVHLHEAEQGLCHFVIDKYCVGRRYAIMRRIAKCLPEGTIGKALLWRDCLNEFFKDAVRHGESGDWAGSMNALSEMHEPFEELQQTLRHLPEAHALIEDHETLACSFQHQMAMAQSAQHLSVARRAQNKLLHENEEIDMDCLWFAMDEFKAATLAGAGMSCESEAAALSGQGIMYLKVLKMDDVAKKMFDRAVRVAMTITQATGKDFHAVDWYKSATAGLKEIQDASIRRTTQEEDEKIGPIKEKLKPVLDAMTTAIEKSESPRFRAKNLLQHIYEVHPPKNGEAYPADLDFENNNQVKKALLKAVTHYHTDKRFNNEHGLEWRVLCGEICKEINVLYSYFKSMPTTGASAGTGETE